MASEPGQLLRASVPPPRSPHKWRLRAGRIGCTAPSSASASLCPYCPGSCQASDPEKSASRSSWYSTRAYSRQRAWCALIACSFYLLRRDKFRYECAPVQPARPWRGHQAAPYSNSIKTGCLACMASEHVAISRTEARRTPAASLAARSGCFQDARDDRQERPTRDRARGGVSGHLSSPSAPCAVPVKAASESDHRSTGPGRPGDFGAMRPASPRISQCHTAGNAFRHGRSQGAERRRRFRACSPCNGLGSIRCALILLFHTSRAAQ